MKTARTSGLVFLFLLLPWLALAQQSEKPSAQPKEEERPSVVTVPAGTRIPLALTHPLQTRRMHRGDDVYALVTVPVTSGNEVVIPPGTYLRGQLDRFSQKAGRANVRLQSLTMTFPNGYVASVSGPVMLTSTDLYTAKDPSASRTTAAFLLPFAGTGIGAAIGHAAHSTDSVTMPGFCPAPCPLCPPPPCPAVTTRHSSFKGTAIGSLVGTAVGGMAALVILTRSPDMFLDTGTPVDIALGQTLFLDRDRVADAIAKASQHPVQPIAPVLPPRIVRTPNASGSSATWDCPVGQEWCGGRCMSGGSFMSDSSNCGRCGNHCSFSEACTGGSCSCAPGYSSCMGSCTSDSSFISDNNNCGRCGNSCSIGESCLGGSCRKL